MTDEQENDTDERKVTRALFYWMWYILL